ncbi:hypothetical protein [Legionella jamestowniensis]|uniref:Transmembrane protein n=1 Tax=Legionella jamestowniensis TaxID=455 RepID=A0A0W0UIB4_9GAMM|nr:hypothetical protein [Legionella jamestowniensis]KTD07643.1 hypothetical protein Ljam_1838 [Legionella jamestowniensis]OCH99386.1 hypothetical protein A8135_06785 [Legionella jamestowniensis]SFL59965.1 hypothetical protein SAMN02746073_0956 [Legionella jamestowniensis DSM 19215]
MITETNHCHHVFKRISWTAIFVGALVGVGLGFLLNLFGIAIGLSLFTLNQEGATVLAIGGLIGLLIGVIASMIVAGYAAGYLGRLYCPKRNLGILYGFTTWVISLILGAIMAGHMSSYVSTYTTHVSRAVATTQTTTPNVTRDETSNQTTTAPAGTAVPANVSPDSLAWGAFMIFVLFFIGAVSTCIGACWGMSCKREDE